LKQEQLRVLKVMSEATGHVDFKAFANMADLQPNEAMAILRELAKTGHLKKVGSGYGLTEKGKTTLKVLNSVPSGSKFEFYFEIGKPTGHSAATPMEFYEIIWRINTSSLEFHLCRKDFEMWARNTLGNSVFADELAGMERIRLSGETLRSAMIKTFESVYSLA